MTHLLNTFISNLENIIEHGGYFILFIMNVLEGIPIIGPLIPGHTVVLFSGFLSKIHVLNIWIVIVIVIIGAILGDFIGYSIGKKYGLNFIVKFGKYFFVKQEHIEKARKIVDSHTGKAIIFGRFSPITRPLAPFIVGASGIHINKFWLYDIIGVLIWGIGSILIGYIFGASYHIISGYIGKYILIAIIIAFPIIWGYRFINKNFVIFAKYELFTLFFNLLGLYVFFKTIQDTFIDMGYFVNLDLWINYFFINNINAFCLTSVNIITDILSPTFLSILSLLIIIYYLFKKKWINALIYFLSMSGGLILTAFIKELVMRARPINSLLIENDFSFPSGHALSTTIFFVLAIYFISSKIKNNLFRELYVFFCILLIILSSVCRLYLGVHWFSDVLAGISLGVFWTTLIIIFVKYIGILISKLNFALSSEKDK